MTSQPGQLQSEDSMSFLTSTVGALGSTLAQQPGSPSVLFFGLLVSAISKALPSLETNPKDRVEDGALFGASILSFLAAGLQTNWKFSDPSGLVYGLLLLGIILKTGLSLRNKPMKYEDLASLVIALVAIASIPFASQYASVGLFLSILAKTLLNSPSDSSTT